MANILTPKNNLRSSVEIKITAYPSSIAEWRENFEPLVLHVVKERQNKARALQKKQPLRSPKVQKASPNVQKVSPKRRRSDNFSTRCTSGDKKNQESVENEVQRQAEDSMRADDKEKHDFVAADDIISRKEEDIECSMEMERSAEVDGESNAGYFSVAKTE